MTEGQGVAFARRLRASGQLQEALDQIGRVLQQAPRSAEAWLEKADILAAGLQHEQARLAYGRALEELPETERKSRAHALRWTGITTRRLGDAAGSLTWLKDAIALADHREAQHHLAMSFFVLGDATNAVHHGVNAIVRQEDNPADYLLLSSVLSGLGDWDSNAWLLRRCLDKAAFPNRREQSRAIIQLGASLQMLGRGDEAQAEFQKAMKIDPAAFGTAKPVEHEANQFLSQARQNFGVFKASGKLPAMLRAAAEQMARLKRLGNRPWLQARNQLHRFQWPLGHTQEIALELASLRRIWRKNPRDARLASSVDPYMAIALPMFSAQDCKFAARVAADRTHAAIEQRYQHLPADYSRGDGKLQVGIYTADLRIHPMLSPLLAFVHHYPAERMDLTLFHNSAQLDMLETIESQIRASVDVGGMDDDQAAAEIHGRKIEVFIDCTGSTGEGRPGIAARRPAPVQVAWGGFPGTSGDPAIDYLVADEHTLPPALADTVTEKVIYLQGTWLINDHQSLYADEVTELGGEECRQKYRAGLGLPMDQIVFANLGRLWKIDDVTLDAWCHIVDQVPGSVLWLVAFGEDAGAVQFATEHIRNRWAELNGMAADRLVITEPLPVGEHLKAAAAGADICLDTPAYNGGMTTVDMIFSGVPVIATPGHQQKFMQRASGSVLRAAGLPELAAADLEAYVELAVRMGRDTGYRQSIRDRIQAAIAGEGDAILFRPHTNIDHLVRGLETAFDTFRTGKAADHIWTY